MASLTVDESQHKKRLDVVLAGHKRVASRSEAQRIIRDGCIAINQSKDRISANRLVHQGDRIIFDLPSPPPIHLSTTAHELDILFEDEHLIVLNKPAGMVVHPAAGHHEDTLVNYLLHHASLSQLNPERPGIVHRLDKDTSGLLVVAKDTFTHQHLADQFAEHKVSRRYEAIVWGIPPKRGGRIEEPIGRHPVDRKRFSIRADGKPAVTHWETLKSFRYCSYLRCRLETGRTHQIRVHLSSIGHPLVGDPVYGRRHPNSLKNIKNERLKLQIKRLEGQALHARTLGFEHPVTRIQMSFDSELPSEIRELLKEFDRSGG